MVVRSLRKCRWFWVDNRIVWRLLPSIGSDAFSVYCALVSFASDGDQKAWPSLATLSKITGLCERTVRKSIRILIQHGLIAMAPSYRPNGSQSTNIYYILDPFANEEAVNWEDEEEIEDEEDEEPAEEYPSEGIPEEEGGTSQNICGVSHGDTPINYTHMNYIDVEQIANAICSSLEARGLHIVQEAREESPKKEVPTNFAGWLEKISQAPSIEFTDSLGRKRKGNAVMILEEMFRELYPLSEAPDFGRMGVFMKRVGSAQMAAELLWRHSVRPPNGDVLSYIEAVIKSEKARGSDGQKGYREGGGGEAPKRNPWEYDPNKRLANSDVTIGDIMRASEELLRREMEEARRNGTWGTDEEEYNDD